jgi:hypothetical protein
MRSASCSVSPADACVASSSARGGTRSRRALRRSRRLRGRGRAECAHARPSPRRARRSPSLQAPAIASSRSRPARTGERRELAPERPHRRGPKCAGRNARREASTVSSQCRVGVGELKVLTRYRRMPNGADRCWQLRTRLAEPMQAFWLAAGRPRASRDCHGKEGSPVRVRGLSRSRWKQRLFSCPGVLTPRR